jgi:tetratricopeptide (TPR) repeat protein
MVESPHPALYLPLMMSVGDAFWARGDSMMASVLYERLRRADITDAYTEAASLRLHGLRDPESRLFLRYFVTDADDSVHSFILDSINLGSPDDQLARFLRGKLLLREGKFEEAWNVLKTIDMAEVDPRLEASRLTATGHALFRLKKFQEAKAAYWLSLNFHPGEAAYNDVITCVERCEWMSAHGF